MTTLLSEAGRAFIRTFLSVFIPLVAGILAAPNLASARSLSIAALVAALAAGFKSIQAFVPQLTFSQWVPAPLGAMVDDFVRAFLSSIIVFLTGWLAAPELAGWRTIGIAALTGAFAAGFRAIQGFFTPGDHPAPNTGFSVPGTPEKPPRSHTAAGYSTR